VALDTVAKRFSAIHLGSPWRGILPIPDGALGQGDRQTFFYFCSTPLADVEVVVVPSTTATLIRNATSYAFITSTPTAYANITTTPGTLDVDVEDE
jgi:hypothetical protein